MSKIPVALSVKTALILAVLALVVVGVGVITWAAFFSLQSLQALKKTDLQLAAQQAGKAQPIVHALRKVSFSLIPDLVVWDESLSITRQAPTALATLTEVIEVAPDEDTLTRVRDVTQPLSRQLEVLSQTLPRTIIFKRVIPPEYQTLLQSVGPQFKTLNDHVLTGNKTFVVIFQNSDELRPTGGFLGSLAFIKLDNGSITEMKVFDVYQVAGRLTVRVIPPPGVQEYLSEDKGWQLSDANWSPDFPTTARVITEMLQLSEYSSVDGVIAVNLDTARQLLKVTGNVFLPDYQMTVTSDNVNQVLRSNRDQFFAGSIAKQHLLGSFVTALKTKLMALPPERYPELLSILSQETQSKNLLFFSHHKDVQSVFEHFKITGEFADTLEKSNLYLGLIEANVGINKANAKISRALHLAFSPTSSTVQLSIHNHNSPADRTLNAPAAADHMHYVNYQRLWLRPDTSVSTLTINGQATTWKENTITTYQGIVVKEISFLSITREGEQSVVNIELKHPPLEANSSISLPLQPGVPPYPVTWSWNGKTQTTTFSPPTLELELPGTI